MKITINAGHFPGKDPGAVGKTGLQEAIVAKDVMQKVAKYLEKVGYTVLQVQENELYEICQKSNKFNAELFVSIHCNSSTNANAKGTETFCYQFGGKAEKLATEIQNELIKTIKTSNRGVKQANFQVLRDTDCSAALVELAFISNTEEEKMLADATCRNVIAAAIARGITNYVAKKI